MVGMDRHRHGDAQFVANGIDMHGNVVEIDRAIVALRPGNLDDQGRIGALGGLQGAADDKTIAAVGGNGHRLALGRQGPVDHLAADDQGLGMGKTFGNIRGSADLNQFFIFCIYIP